MHYFQTPQESKDYLDAWADRLRLPINKEVLDSLDKEKDMHYNGTTESIKATVVCTSQKEIEKRMAEIDMALKTDFTEGYQPFFDSYGNEVNPASGEVISQSLVPAQQEDTIIIQNNDPVYIMRLNALDMPQEDKAALLSIYDSPIVVKSFKSYINKTVEIFGAIIWTHPPYVPKGSPEGTIVPGYNVIRLLTMEGGEPVIIDASFGALATHIDALLRVKGWFLWDEPCSYNFGQDEKTNAFRMVNTERVKFILSGKKKPPVTPTTGKAK